MSACLLVLLGLPGAGKSTVARLLQSRLADMYDVMHVEYDVLCGDVSEAETVKWREVRGRALTSAEQLCCDVIGKVKRRLVVLDDNMYLRSMRYQCFQLARRRGLGFAQIHLAVDLQTCSGRNADRCRPVPESVLRRMSERLERPDPVRHCWELNTLTLPECSDDDLVRSVIELVNSALASPAPPIADRSQSVQEARRVCSTNEQHLLDCALRRLVRDHVSGRSERAAAANQARRLVLQQVKSGEIQLCGDLAPQSIESTAHSLFHSQLAS